WTDADGRPLPTRPCARCGSPTPIFRMTVEDVRRNGWIPFLPALVAHWCGHSDPDSWRGRTVRSGPGDRGSVVEIQQMDRRTFVGTLTIALLAAPLVARAQQAQKTVHIGVMSSGQ